MKVLAACLRMRGQLVGQVEVCGGGEGGRQPGSSESAEQAAKKLLGLFTCMSDGVSMQSVQ